MATGKAKKSGRHVTGHMTQPCHLFFTASDGRAKPGHGTETDRMGRLHGLRCAGLAVPGAASKTHDFDHMAVAAVCCLNGSACEISLQIKKIPCCTQTQ